MKGRLAIEGLGCETARVVATVQEPRNTTDMFLDKRKVAPRCERATFRFNR